MREVTEDEYRRFLATHDHVTIEGSVVKLVRWGQISLFEPQDFRLEKTTVWSFENRGKWATHRADYRVNWVPEVPASLLQRRNHCPPTA